jgi:asparagine synthetase B (glutamine-hydrolysing)
VTYKNITMQSQKPEKGAIWITYNGKNYRFAQSQDHVINDLGDGSAVINPLISKTTNLVFEIPEEITGPVYWQPGSDNTTRPRVSLGTIKSIKIQSDLG